MIAFIGSVFSPYYARARRRAGADGADPCAHVAFNVSLYEPDGRRWTMTERGETALQRSATTLRIGPSAARWDGTTLVFDLDEWTVPWPRRVRGQLRVRPLALQPGDYALDARGRHRWWPMAPIAEIQVDLQQPALRWSGRAYLDGNRGSEPLEQAFTHWHWARAHLDGDRAMVVYDAQRRDGSRGCLCLRFHVDRAPESVIAPPPCRLPDGAWRLGRDTRNDRGEPMRQVQAFENGPFYTRSLLAGRWHGEPLLAVHESLDLDRFDRPWVQGLLPFRMPRRA